LEKYHEAAKDKGVLIIPTCGYDSIPSDLGVQYLTEYVKRTYNCDCRSIVQVVQKVSGGVSGGTIASIVNELTGKHVSNGPYSLNPPDKRPQLVQPKDFTFVGYNAFLKQWTIPFLMAGINTRVVRRSQALQDFKYGQFQYSEKVGIQSLFKAVISWFVMLTGILAIALPFTRPLLLWFLPKPGQGPKRETFQRGGLSLAFVGELNTKDKNAPTHVVERITAKGEVGYYLTSIMVSQAAIALALDRKSLPLSGGVVTPAAALGDVLRERLIKKGFTFSIDKEKTN